MRHADNFRRLLVSHKLAWIGGQFGSDVGSWMGDSGSSAFDHGKQSLGRAAGPLGKTSAAFGKGVAKGGAKVGAGAMNYAVGKFRKNKAKKAEASKPPEFDSSSPKKAIFPKPPT